MKQSLCVATTSFRRPLHSAPSESLRLRLKSARLKVGQVEGRNIHKRITYIISEIFILVKETAKYLLLTPK